MRIAHKEIQPIIKIQNELREKVGKPKREVQLVLPPADLSEAAFKLLYEPASHYFNQGYIGKMVRRGPLNEMKDKCIAELKLSFPDASSTMIDFAVDHTLETAYRNNVLRMSALHKEGEVANSFNDYYVEKEKEIVLPASRVDGRSLTAVRPIEADMGVVPLVHGSSFFKRGDTSTLCVVTLGNTDLAQYIDAVSGSVTRKMSFLQYEFPPYSINEVGRVGGVNRRSIGHGSLAEKALKAVFPSEAEFPYSFRINSEVLSSDGSSSMATVCGGALALLDAEVPIKALVAGISCGLVTENNGFDYRQDVGKYAVCTDILGMEDYYGDMDFKMAGTRDGITAVQLDVKTPGVPVEILAEAVLANRLARGKVLDVMEAAVAENKIKKDGKSKDSKLFVAKVPIKRGQRGIIIGPGGSVLKKLETVNKVEIKLSKHGLTVDEAMLNKADFEDLDDYVLVYGKDADSVNDAKREIEMMTEAPEIGRSYMGTIVETRDGLGAFVSILAGGVEGLMHISEISHNKAECEEILDELKPGDQVEVQILDINRTTGKMKLSRKALLPVSPPTMLNQSVGNMTIRLFPSPVEVQAEAEKVSLEQPTVEESNAPDQYISSQVEGDGRVATTAGGVSLDSAVDVSSDFNPDRFLQVKLEKKRLELERERERREREESDKVEKYGRGNTFHGARKGDKLHRYGVAESRSDDTRERKAGVDGEESDISKNYNGAKVHERRQRAPRVRDERKEGVDRDENDVSKNHNGAKFRETRQRAPRVRDERKEGVDGDENDVSKSYKDTKVRERRQRAPRVRDEMNEVVDGEESDVSKNNKGTKVRERRQRAPQVSNDDENEEKKPRRASRKRSGSNKKSEGDAPGGKSS
jgi:polyribonucleotide nucleotidyltransferase